MSLSLPYDHAIVCMTAQLDLLCGSVVCKTSLVIYPIYRGKGTRADRKLQFQSIKPNPTL